MSGWCVFAIFTGRYEGGLDQSLISCVKYLESRGINDGELSVSESYTNLGKHRQSKFGLLCDRDVVGSHGQKCAGQMGFE